ncbi:hypothetical protein D3C73_1014750 [compost metagenome]
MPFFTGKGADDVVVQVIGELPVVGSDVSQGGLGIGGFAQVTQREDYTGRPARGLPEQLAPLVHPRQGGRLCCQYVDFLKTESQVTRAQFHDAAAEPGRSGINCSAVPCNECQLDGWSGLVEQRRNPTLAFIGTEAVHSVDDQANAGAGGGQLLGQVTQDFHGIFFVSGKLPECTGRDGRGSPQRLQHRGPKRFPVVLVGAEPRHLVCLIFQPLAQKHCFSVPGRGADEDGIGRVVELGHESGSSQQDQGQPGDRSWLQAQEVRAGTTLVVHSFSVGRGIEDSPGKGDPRGDSRT